MPSGKYALHANENSGVNPYEFSIENFQELLIVHPRTVTILYPLSYIFLILPQYIVVFPVLQDLSRIRVSVVKRFLKVQLF